MPTARVSRLHHPAWPFVGAFLVLAVVLAGYVLAPTDPVDQWVLDSMVAARTPLLTSVMAALTWCFDPWRATILAVGLGLLVGWRTRQWRYGVFVTGSVALSALVTTKIKLVHGRARPPELLRLVVEHSASFPSGHTTAAASLFVSLALVWVVTRSVYRRGELWLVWSAALLGIALIGLTRLYLAAHWLTDVIGGACVGIACVLAMIPVWLVSDRAAPRPTIQPD